MIDVSLRGFYCYYFGDVLGDEFVVFYILVRLVDLGECLRS